MCIPCSISATCVTSPTRTTASLTFSKVVLTAEETRVYQIPWEKQQRKLQKKQSKPVNNRMTRRVSSNDMRRKNATYKNIVEQNRPTVEQVQKWAVDFEALIEDEVGQKLFYLFLQSEHSEENLQFWKEVNNLRRIASNKEKQCKIKCIYKEFIKPMALKEVNIAGNTRKQIEDAIENKPCETMFDGAQAQVYLLMHRQSYPRFVQSDMFHAVLQNTHAYNSISPKTVQSKKISNVVKDKKSERYIENKEMTDSNHQQQQQQQQSPNEQKGGQRDSTAQIETEVN